MEGDNSDIVYRFRWLVKKHHDEKASRVLVKLRHSSPDEVKEELEEIQASVKESELDGAKAWWWAWRALLRWKIIQRCEANHLINKLIFSFNSA